MNSITACAATARLCCWIAGSTAIISRAQLFVASIPILLVGGFWLRPAWWLLATELAAYVLLALAFAFRLAHQSSEGRLIVLLPIIFFTIHCSWGASLLVGF